MNKRFVLKPRTTEKAVRIIELENVLIFEIPRHIGKEEIKKELETMFKVKVIGIRTLIKQNKKIAYVRFDKKNPAIDIATKLGMI